MALDPNIRINLDRSVVLLIEHNPQAMDALTAMFRGFGVRKQFKCASATEAMHVVKTQELDLIVTDANLPEMDGYDFVHWLRREAPEAMRFTPVIMLTGHAAKAVVEKSRDSGANFVVALPFTPEVLLQRVFWVAKDDRPDGGGRGLCGSGPPLQEPGPAPRRQGPAQGRSLHACGCGQGSEHGSVRHRHAAETDEGPTVSEAEFVKVKYRLTEQVARAGGMTAGLASDRAQRELAAHAGDAMKSLGGMIGRLEIMCKERVAPLDAVYEEGSTILDIAGLFNKRVLCDACYSLCELVDRQRTHNRQDWTSIAVHVNALRLLWTKDGQDPATLKSVVDGLVDHHRPPEPLGASRRQAWRSAG